MAAFNSPSIPLPSVVVVPNNETVGGTLGVTGVTTVAAGSAAAPAVVSVTGTSDTGVFFPAADTVAASTAGSERLRIDSSGNVGIGTTSPTYQTQVNGSGQATAALTDAGAKGSLLYLRDDLSSSGNGGGVLLGANATTPFAAMKGLLNNVSGQTTGELAFSTRNATGDVALTERMRITSGGNVGINTTSPTNVLEVKADTSRFFCATNPTTSLTAKQISIGESSNNPAYRLQMGYFTDGSYKGSIQSLDNSTGSSLAINAAGGYVGIGTASPTVQLETSKDGGGGDAGQLVRFTDSSTGSGIGPTSLTIGMMNKAAGAPQMSIAGTTGLAFCVGSGSDFNAQRKVSINSSGYLGIGMASASYLLQVNTDSAGKPGVGGVWTVVSDERIKTDIVPADLDRCYQIVKSVPLKHFGFRPGVYTDEQIQDKHSLGWIAQDVQAVFEKAVSVKPFTIHTPQADGTVQDEVIDDCLDLNSGQMIAALYGCVQALMAKVEALEARG